jgi:hypothetical protein
VGNGQQESLAKAQLTLAQGEPTKCYYAVGKCSERHNGKNYLNDQGLSLALQEVLTKNVLIFPIPPPKLCVNLNMNVFFNFFLRRYSVEVCEKTPSPLLVRNKGLTLAVRQSSGHSLKYQKYF